MGKNTNTDLSPEEVYDEIEVLEPYTTGELASYFDVSKQRIRDLLERLSSSGKVRKKEPESKHTIWIREAPIHKCPNCEYKYEVKFLHPVFSVVQFCPRCGGRL